MADKNIKWIIIGIVTVAVTLMILNNNKKEVYFNKIDIPKTHFIYNRTERKYLDTIISTGLTILKTIPFTVIVKDLESNTTMGSADDEYRLEAYIRASIGPVGNQYIIYITDVSRDKSIRILSHELIHLIQYDRGMLQLFDDYIIWKEKVYLNKDIPEYFDREWEHEAVGLGAILETEIKRILIPNKDDTKE